MASVRQAATVRVIYALCSVTDFIKVRRFNRDECTIEVEPPDAVAAGKQFSDYHIGDAQMQFFQDQLAKCCPEPDVSSAVRQWSMMRSATEIQKVISMVETLILGQPTTWHGRCIADQAFRDRDS